MNAQLSTLDQSRQLVEELNARGIGGGVLPEVNTGSPESPNFENDKSGIYLERWDGPFIRPDEGDYKPYLLRFQNGVGGMNVGLMLDKLKRFKMAPEYCYRTFAAEVDAMAGDQ